ncbi:MULTISPECIES: hypothetical protein [Candidatus Ichthyocystis]|nr:MULTISPECIES: hypothetical protein [Ichthyocystis]
MDQGASLTRHSPKSPLGLGAKSKGGYTVRGKGKHNDKKVDNVQHNIIRKSEKSLLWNVRNISLVADIT